MALDTVITGANLDAAGNVKTALSNTPANIGGVRHFSENDPGTITGVPYLRSPETSHDSRLRVGTDTVLFSDTFNATAQNTHNWYYSNATMTASQSTAGMVNFGTVQGTAPGHVAYMNSYQHFPMIGTAPLSAEFTVGQFTAPLVANEVWIMGLALVPISTALPTDGVYLQITSAGIVGAAAYNGTTTQTGVLAASSSMTVDSLYKFAIVVSEGLTEFWMSGAAGVMVLLGKLVTPAGNGQPFIAASQHLVMYKYCTAAVSNTNTMRVSDVTVSLLDIASNKPWAHQLATQGMSRCGQNGHTQGKNTLWANNTAPTAVALTNTTAAFTGLGGIAAVLPTLAANSDGIVFNYTNPALAINVTGRNLIITGVNVQGAVSVILAGGPVTFAYAIAHNHTAVSLATAETASFATITAHAPRITPIGMETYPATAAVGTLGGGMTIQFETPIVVRPSEMVALIARNIGVVTTTGAITIIAAFDHYYE